jgi:plasmid stabilization system protein ParE
MVQKIIWSNEATENLSSIKNYISIDSEFYAFKLINLIYTSVQKLLQFPEIGMPVYQTEKYLVRRILIKNYRLLYILKDDIIYIIAIYHQLRQLPQTLDIPELF